MDFDILEYVFCPKPFKDIIPQDSSSGAQVLLWGGMRTTSSFLLLRYAHLLLLCICCDVFIYLNFLIIKYILKMILDMDNVKENNNNDIINLVTEKQPLDNLMTILA